MAYSGGEVYKLGEILDTFFDEQDSLWDSRTELQIFYEEQAFDYKLCFSKRYNMIEDTHYCFLREREFNELQKYLDDGYESFKI